MHREIISIGIKLRSPVSISYIYALASGMLQGASDAGLMVGVYIYSQATTTEEAAAEADYLANLADKYHIDLPIVMDYELYNGGRLARAINSGSLGTSGINKNALAFARRGWNRGYETMLYGNYDFLMHYASGYELSRSTNIWLAQYHTPHTKVNI